MRTVMVTLTLSLPKGKRNPSMHFQREPRTFYVYIMTDRSQTLYTGVTSKLGVRVWQHKNHLYEGFTSRYGLDRLVYYEAFSGSGMR